MKRRAQWLPVAVCPGMFDPVAKPLHRAQPHAIGFAHGSKGERPIPIDLASGNGSLLPHAHAPIEGDRE